VSLEDMVNERRAFNIKTMWIEEYGREVERKERVMNKKKKEMFFLLIVTRQCGFGFFYFFIFQTRPNPIFLNFLKNSKSH
jgi:hypothetical protein